MEVEQWGRENNKIRTANDKTVKRKKEKNKTTKQSLPTIIKHFKIKHLSVFLPCEEKSDIPPPISPQTADLSFQFFWRVGWGTSFLFVFVFPL
jgi:hypothetical protein